MKLRSPLTSAGPRLRAGFIDAPADRARPEPGQRDIAADRDRGVVAHVTRPGGCPEDHGHQAEAQHDFPMTRAVPAGMPCPGKVPPSRPAVPNMARSSAAAAVAPHTWAST